MRIEHPSPTEFHYAATVKGIKGPIDKPKLLELDRGESITFESPAMFELRFAESPFIPADKTVLYGTSNGTTWTTSAQVREDAVYHHSYHYAVIVGDHSTDDPEIVIEQF